MRNRDEITDFDDDFGFTLVGEEEISNKDISETYKQKLMQLHKMIMPLLKNLLKNPEKDYIHWPNRDKKINDFIQKMNKVIEE